MKKLPSSHVSILSLCVLRLRVCAMCVCVDRGQLPSLPLSILDQGRNLTLLLLV